MTMNHRAVGNRDIFTGNALRRIFCPGFNGDTIIPHINIAIGNPHILARLWIDTIRIGRVCGIVNIQIIDGHIATALGMDRPARGVDTSKVFQCYPLAAFKAY